MELGPEDASLLERYPHFSIMYRPGTCRSVLISEGVMSRQSMELGPEDVSLLERCPRVHFRGCYVQAVNGAGT